MRVLILACLAMSAALAPADPPVKPNLRPNEESTVAVIEVSGTAVRVVVGKGTAQAKGDLLVTWTNPGKEVLTKSPLVAKSRADAKDPLAIPDERVQDAAEEVARMYELLRTDPKNPLAPRQIRLVASSAFADGNVSNFPKLREAIQSALVGVEKKLDPKVDPKLLEAVKENFVPEPVPSHIELAHQLNGMGVAPTERVVLIDLGSGRLKCGYLVLESESQLAKYHTLKDVVMGTKKQSDELLKKLGLDCERVKFLADLDAEIDATAAKALKVMATQTAPGVKNRFKYYLVGGAAWAMATIMHPEDAASETTEIKYADFAAYSKLVRQITQNTMRFPDVKTAHLSAPVRLAANDELGRVGDTFSAEHLAAGAAILSAVAEAYDLKNEKKSITFVRNCQYSWQKDYCRSVIETELLAK